MKREFLLTASASALFLALAACGAANDAGATDPADASAENDTSVATATTGSDNALPEIELSQADIAGNPLLADWDTPYGVPPFSQISEDDFMPAVKKGVLELRQEIDTIIKTDEAPSFGNTVLAMEQAGGTLSKATAVFGNIANTESNDTIRALEGEIYPMLTREYDAIMLNAALWERVKTVWADRANLDLDEQDARLLELTHRDFVRAGADLPVDVKAQIAEINAEISSLTTTFGQNLLKSTKAFKLEITDEAQLAGLADDFRSGIKVEGEDKWVITLDRSVYETFMTQSENRELREKVFNGYRLRASEGEFDNGPVLIKIAQLRARRAELMGYDSHAHYTLETRMAKTPQEAEDFLLRVWRPGLAQAKQERDAMQEMVGDAYAIAGHDWWHLAEKVRQDRYAFDDNALKPYFKLESVREGSFEMARRLFKVDFEPVETPVWNDVVEVFKLTDSETKEHLGLFMVDMYARDSKRGGAWMSSYRGASDIGGKDIRPLVTNNLNLIKPPAGEPTLMRFDEVETLFHEFGHGLHGLLTQVKYEKFSGVDGPLDYTEFPAQILEHWAGQPEMLSMYATHYETGEPIPTELINKMNEARNFNQGFRTTEYVAASLLDLAWHALSYEDAMAVTDARAFEKQVLEEYGLIEEIEPRYRSNYFAHIFAGGYSAGYYAYLWSEILDADGFYAFKEAGDIFDPQTAAKLKKWVYESGGLKPADELYRNFRGADPSIDPLLEIRGFKPPESEG